jgi:hypothetical protein
MKSGHLFLTALPAGGWADAIRVATFNASLNRNSEGELNADLASGSGPQISAVAETLQGVAPGRTGDEQGTGRSFPRQPPDASDLRQDRGLQGPAKC